MCCPSASPQTHAAASEEEAAVHGGGLAAAVLCGAMMASESEPTPPKGFQRNGFQKNARVSCVVLRGSWHQIIWILFDVP
jgi:hypothetical protein